jgi:hypothetical protein
MEGVMNQDSQGQPAQPPAAHVFAAIADWVQKYRYAVGLRKELAECGAEEVAHMARDLRVSPRELLSLASKGSHAADQLPKLLRALGVDPDKLASDDPIMMRDLGRICITCGHKSQCEHDLASGAIAQRYHAYCPNAMSLEALFDAMQAGP